MITGYVLKYTDENVNTDLIWPGKFTYVTIPREEMPDKVMKEYDSEFHEKIRERSVLAVGRNFGCGSSREQPAVALKEAGIEAIIAPHFAWIFERNCTAHGLVAIASEELYTMLETDSYVRLDIENGAAYVRCAPGQPVVRVSYDAFPRAIVEQICMGGLTERLRRRFGDNQ